MCIMIHYSPLKCLGQTTGAHRYLTLILVCHANFKWSWKGKPRKHCPFYFSGMECHLQLCDNAKEMVFGKINRKRKESSCHIKLMELFTPWMNAAKKEIKELKKGSCMMLIKSCTPNRLWDDCFELESCIRSNTAQWTYKLDGKVPETIIIGEKSDISQFCEFEWLKWVMFWDKTAAYPNDHFRLDRYLGLSLDIGPALMVKIIKENSLVLHRFT